jgi:aminoglycoside phosphotransferase (APT) family kinase protein
MEPNETTSRSDIYYWKCDNKLSDEERRNYICKYELADITELVYEIAVDHFGDKNLTVRQGNGEGNHYTYVVRTGQREIFFRADDGKVDDDYMEAENAAMELVRQHGVRVPQVYHHDVSMKKYPIRYQFMELLQGECLNIFYKDQTLDRERVGLEVGRLLAKMHGIELDGFGFFNTNVLCEEKRIVGLDRSNKDYFLKNVDSHLEYLYDHDFLDDRQIQRIVRALEKNMCLLELDRGSVVHKDIAFWNIIGTQDEVHAIIDWDDVISGDPADDIAVMRCFYNDDILGPVYRGYEEVTEMSDLFRAKTSLYLVRNMIWKSVIRIKMKYFEMNESFLLNDDNQESLEQFTYDRLYMGVDELEKL